MAAPSLVVITMGVHGSRRRHRLARHVAAGGWMGDRSVRADYGCGRARPRTQWSSGRSGGLTVECRIQKRNARPSRGPSAFCILHLRSLPRQWVQARWPPPLANRTGDRDIVELETAVDAAQHESTPTHVAT